MLCIRPNSSYGDPRLFHHTYLLSCTFIFLLLHFLPFLNVLKTFYYFALVTTARYSCFVLPPNIPALTRPGVLDELLLAHPGRNAQLLHFLRLRATFYPSTTNSHLLTLFIRNTSVSHNWHYVLL